MEYQSIFRPLIVRFSKLGSKSGTLVDDAIDGFIAGTRNVIPLFKESMIDHPSCGTILAMQGLCGFLQGELNNTSYRTHFPSNLKSKLDDLEKDTHELSKIHVRACQALIDKTPRVAINLWEDRMLNFPLDVFSLRCLQESYIRSGNNTEALRCVERVLSEWEPHIDGYSRVLGMHSLGLAMCNYFSEAEEAAGRSLTISTDNINAVRAVTYSFTCTGKHREGSRVLREFRDFYNGQDEECITPFLNELNHRSDCYLLETGRYATVFQNQETLLQDHAEGVAKREDLHQYLPWHIDTLWKLLLLNMDTPPSPGRSEKPGFVSTMFSATSPAACHEASIRELFSPYGAVATFEKENCGVPMLHIRNVMALVGGGDDSAASHYIKEMESYDPDSPALGVARALLYFGKGDFAKSVKLLQETRSLWGALGSSYQHTMVMLHETLIVGLLKAAGANLYDPHPVDLDDAESVAYLKRARAELSVRVLRLPTSPQSWRYFSILQVALGNDYAADVSLIRAKDYGYQQGGSY